MHFTLKGLKPTTVTEGLGGSTFHSAHLVHTYGVDKPHELSYNARNMAELFSQTSRYNDKPMLSLTEAKGKKIYLTSDIYTWKLKGFQPQKLRVVENLEASTAKIGINGTEFKVVLDRPWYKYPDVVISEDNRYPMFVIGQPKQRGVGYEYTLKLQTTKEGRSLPARLLEVGRKFCKVATNIEREMNQDYGTMQFNSVFNLRSWLGQAAMELTVSDRLLRVDKNGNSVEQLRHWRVPFLDSNGNVYMNFMPMAEAEMWNQLYNDIEWSLNYGRASVDYGPAGYLKRTPPGWREQFEYSNILEHNGNLTLSRLDNWLSSIFRGRRDANPQSRKIILMTGEMGALMFDRMAASDASSFVTVDSHYIRGGDFRHLSYGAQYTHYVGKNGLDVTVMLNPQYDDPTLCPQVHPIYPDTTLDSWRMDIFDFGSTKQDSGAMSDNIQMVAEKFADHYFSTNGKWDIKTGMPINDGSQGFAGGVGGYTIKAEKSYGLMITDISRCGMIKLNVAAA